MVTLVSVPVTFNTILNSSIEMRRSLELGNFMCFSKLVANVLEWFGPASNGVELLKTIQALTSQAWFHGAVTKQQAEQYLQKDHHPGSFLVRFSTSSPGCFTISALSKTKQITHFKVTRNVAGGPFVFGQNTYPTLDSIIQQSKNLPTSVFIRKAVDYPSMFQVVLAAHKQVITHKISTESIYGLADDDTKEAEKKKK